MTRVHFLLLATLSPVGPRPSDPKEEWENRQDDTPVMLSTERELPDFSSGGVIFFLHIPKTGGTTVRRNLEKLETVNYVFGRNFSVYSEKAPLVEQAILYGTPNQTVLFFEIHANDAPSFFRLRKKLQRWRSTAASNNVPAFFFTLLRDPLDFAFSHFNFFHIQERNPTFERCNATESEFLRKSLENPQCHFLYKGEVSLRAQKPKRVTIRQSECLEVQENLWNLMDRVGLTERLSNETLPLLARILRLSSDFEFRRERVSSQTREAYFSKENVSQSTIEKIWDWSLLDSSAYASVQKRYPYRMWRNHEYDGDEL